MKLYLLLTAFSLLSACTTFQPSHYSNYSTPYANVVNASGHAAIAAAGSNATYNCPSCAISGNRRGNYRSPRAYDYRQQSTRLNRITDSALDSLGAAISNRINREIYNWSN